MQVRIWKTGNSYSNLQTTFVISVLPRGCRIFAIAHVFVSETGVVFSVFNIHFGQLHINSLLQSLSPVFWGSPAFVTKKTIKTKTCFYAFFFPAKKNKPPDLLFLFICIGILTCFFYSWPARFFQQFFPPTLGTTRPGGTVLWVFADPGDRPRGRFSGFARSWGRFSALDPGDGSPGSFRPWGWFSV